MPDNEAQPRQEAQTLAGGWSRGFCNTVRSLSLAGFQNQNSCPRGAQPPASASHTLPVPPYLVAPSPPGRAKHCTQGKSQQPRRLQWSRDESVGQDKTGVGAISPTHGGRDTQGQGRSTSKWEERNPQPKPKDARCPSSQLAQQDGS